MPDPLHATRPRGPRKAGHEHIPGELDPLDVVLREDPELAARLHSLKADPAACDEAERRLEAIERDGFTPESATGRALADLARRINRAHRRGGGPDRVQMVGELLLEAKALCGHGHFRKWFADNVRLGVVRGHRYMQAARGNWAASAP